MLRSRRSASPSSWACSSNPPRRRPDRPCLPRKWRASRSVKIRSATLSVTVALLFNLPFQALGALSVEKVHFTQIGQPAFDEAAESSLGTLATRGAIGDVLSIDVASALAADVADGHSQYRLRFERDSVDDGVPNVVVFSLADTRLSVTSLVP